MKASETLYRPVRVHEALVAVLILAIIVAVVAVGIDRGTDHVPTARSGTAYRAHLESQRAEAARMQVADSSGRYYVRSSERAPFPTPKEEPSGKHLP
jgi:hypothetical protein